MRSPDGLKGRCPFKIILPGPGDQIGAAAIFSLSNFGKTLLKANAAIKEVESLTKLESSQQRFEYLMKKVETLNVSTGKNQALFYSGGILVNVSANEKRFISARGWAEAYAEKTGKMTLEMTEGGKWLDDLKLFENAEIGLTPQQSLALWSRLSERYAQQASGAVTAFAKNTRPTSIFKTTELPVLRSNSNVTHINIR